MKALRAGQVALNPDLSGMPRLRFLRQVGAVARILYMSDDFLTLDGIQAKAFDYRLGNRSALEWVIDQYRVKTDKRSGIVNDPNRADDPEYILKLIGKVVAVSLEAVGIVEGAAQSGGAYPLNIGHEETSKVEIGMGKEEIWRQNHDLC